MGTIFSRVKLSGKHVAALLALMLLSAVTAMLLPTALASMIDIGVAGENRNTILIIAAVMATLAILGCLFNMAATVLSAKVSTKFAADLRREIFHQVQDFSAAEMERFGTASLVTRSTSDGQKAFRRKALQGLHDGFCQQVSADLLRHCKSLSGVAGTHRLISP